MSETRDDKTFNQFVQEVSEVLTGKARDKGYGTSPDSPNPLFQLTGPEHGTGEIIYKAVRYRRLHNPEDLIKAAAWAFLIWRHSDGK